MFRRKSALDEVNGLVAPSALSFKYYKPALNAAMSRLAHTPMQGRVRVNQPALAEHVNIFLIERQYLDANAPWLANNCSYWPGSWSVICDARFIDEVISWFPYAEAGEFEEERFAKAHENITNAKRNFLFEWLLIHELGHLVHGHTKSDLSRAWRFEGSIPVGADIERQADEFYISRLQNDVARQTGTRFGLAGLVTHLYRDAAEEQHSSQVLADQFSKHGDRYIYAAELPITIHCTINAHPPLIVRALNLADNLHFRYPNMIDESGYYERIANNIKVSYKKPRAPKLLPHVAPDEAAATPPVPLLAKHLLLLKGQQGARPWVADVLGRIRGAVDSTDPMNSAFVDLLTAMSSDDPSEAQCALEAMPSKLDSLPEDWRGEFNTIVLFARAGAGLLVGDDAIDSALTQAETHFGRAARYAASDAGRAEALRVLLGIALARSLPRSDALSGRIDAIVQHWCSLEDIDGLDQCVVHDMLAQDCQWCQADKSQSQASLRASADSAMRVATLARRLEWQFILGRALQSELSYLSKLEPQPNLRMAHAWMNLGRTAMFSGGAQLAPQYYTEGVRQVFLSIDNWREDYPDVETLKDGGLVAINNLGWSLLINGQFAEAKKHLNFAFEARGGDAGTQIADEARAAEHATVMQNLSECCLALGEFGAALRHAKLARQIRALRDDKQKSAESAKCEGFALYFGGSVDEGLDLLARYSASIRRLVDYDNLPRGDLISGSYIDGRFVHVDELVDVSAKLHEAQMLPDAFVGSDTIGVAHFPRGG